jgi:hypothetical protein
MKMKNKKEMWPFSPFSVDFVTPPPPQKKRDVALVDLMKKEKLLTKKR